MTSRRALSWLLASVTALGAGCSASSQQSHEVGRSTLPPRWDPDSPHARSASAQAPAQGAPGTAGTATTASATNTAPAPGASDATPEAVTSAGAPSEPYAPELARPPDGSDDEPADDGSGRLVAADGVVWEDPAGRLPALFRAMSDVEARTPGARFAVVQLGDSHTESDQFTSRLRRRLQARLGDGGRGFVPVAGGARDVHRALRGPWSVEHASFQHGSVAYGLGLARARATDVHAEFTLGGRAASRYEVFLERGPTLGGLEYRLDAGPWTRAVMPPQTENGPGTVEITASDAVHVLDLRPAGDGPLVLYGVASERATPGAVLDAVGWIGAQATHLEAQDWSVIGAQLSRRAPALVVLAFGTNESVSTRRDPAVYERALTALIAHVREAVPAATVLLLGPPDVGVRARDGSYHVAPRLIELVAAGRRVAASQQTLFVDLLGLMGGPGTMDAWFNQRPPLAYGDHVHLTSRGYTQLAEAVADDLLRRYDAFRAAQPHGPPARP